MLPWKQFRALGCARSTLCDVAAGGLDGYVDARPYHAPWDYLGGFLVCIEAGADRARRATASELVTADPDARRQLIAAGTAELADALLPSRRARERLDLDALLATADTRRARRRRDRAPRTSARRATCARRRRATG